MMSKMKVSLSLSLILNVLLLGVIAGDAARRYQDRPWNEFKEQLAPETRALMKKTFEEKRQRIRQNRQITSEMKVDLEKILTAEEFDPAAFETSAKAFLDFNRKISDDKLKTINAMAQELPLEERKKVSKKFISILAGERQSRGSRKFGPEMPKEFQPGASLPGEGGVTSGNPEISTEGERPK